MLDYRFQLKNSLGLPPLAFDWSSRSKAKLRNNMNATFIVTLDVESPDVIPDIAVDLEDDLLAAGHDVITVKPWARPTPRRRPRPGNSSNPNRHPSLF
jgi:hypothetical protein